MPHYAEHRIIVLLLLGHVASANSSHRDWSAVTVHICCGLHNIMYMCRQHSTAWADALINVAVLDSLCTQRGRARTELCHCIGVH
jgi:hypothetical protein